jgi:hypothetical protein
MMTARESARRYDDEGQGQEARDDLHVTPFFRNPPPAEACKQSATSLVTCPAWQGECTRRDVFVRRVNRRSKSAMTGGRRRAMFQKNPAITIV